MSSRRASSLSSVSSFTDAPFAAGQMFQNRDYPVLNECRSMLGGLFVRLYGLSPAQLQQVSRGRGHTTRGWLDAHAARRSGD